jgi:hypothetical protein
VTYKSGDHRAPRVALLIEDKIRASFQQAQAERYIERGRSGGGKDWHASWTCLVAPEKYGKGLEGFDARVPLESVRDFFKSGASARAQFKAGIIEQMISDFPEVESRSSIKT